MSKKLPRWKLQHRIFCVKYYYKCSSYKAIEEQFHAFFIYLAASNKSRIADWVKKCETYGTVPDLYTKSENHPSHSGPAQPLWTGPATLDDQEPVQMKLLR